MNIISAGSQKDIVFCFVDNTRQYKQDIRSLIINQADGVLATLHLKGYTILQWVDEDELLMKAAELNYKYAVVFSTGTEFINGNSFFKNLKDLIKQDFFLAGHILDRGDAYYELHHQCYVVNLDHYVAIGKPKVGQQQLGHKHSQIIPCRSDINYHDDYTPTWVLHGQDTKVYNHKCHGWNIFSVGLKHQLPVVVFDNNLRASKKHFYPESSEDFYKHLSWAYERLYYCREKFVHISNTEEIHLPNKKYKQIITPASGTWFKNYSDNNTRIVMYDYNQLSLDYWREQYPNYEYVLTDLLIDNNLLSAIDPSIDETLVNLSNIFNYEGTYFFNSFDYRLNREINLTNKIKELAPCAEIYTTMPVQFTKIMPTWRL